MKAVEQGILINEQHIRNIENGIAEDIPFADAIKALGFEDLEDFFNQKSEYEMQNVLKGNVYSVEPKDAMPTLRKLVSSKKFGVVSVYTSETCVHHGRDDSKFLDYDYCSVNNIPIYPYDSFGGNIVATEGDYSFALFIPESIDISTDFVLARIKDILSKHLDGVTIDNNDILVDGKKVAGTTSFGTNDIYFLICHFSMSSKGKLIENICGKPTTNKEPGYIDTKALTTNELMGELLSWLQGL